jgi:hypothetical protein
MKISVAHNKCTEFCYALQKVIITLDSRNMSNSFSFLKIVINKTKPRKEDEQ